MITTKAATVLTEKLVWCALHSCFYLFVGVLSHSSNIGSPHLSVSWDFTCPAEKSLFTILSANKECSPPKNFQDLSIARLLIP